MRKRGRRARPSRAVSAVLAACLGAALAAAGCGDVGALDPSGARDGAGGAASGVPVTVGSKNFTEQVILGEILSGLIEARCGLPVDRRLELAGTFICFNALKAGEIDLYVEYTGTALTAILEEPPLQDARAAYATVAERFARELDLVWTEPLGFRNDFAIVVRGDDARRHGLKTLSDLARRAPRMKAGFGPEFLSREDGYPGLVETYGLEFASRPLQMDLGLLYRALTDGRVDVVAGNSTDGLIGALGLVVLEDDRAYFPAYEAAPVVRRETLERLPCLRDALSALGGSIDSAGMRRMNHAVDGDRRPHAEVAAEFLERSGLARRAAAVSGPPPGG